MSDPFDDRMRELARAARAEAEADLDVDGALDAVHSSTGTTAVPLRRPRHRRVAGWLTAAAALTFALGAGILFTRGIGDDIATIDGSTPSSSQAPIDALLTVPTTATVTTPATAPATIAPAVPPPTEVMPAPTASTTTDPATSTSSPTTTAASTDDIETSDWRDFRWEGSGIPGSCALGAAKCTQLVHDAAGHPITYEPTARTLTRHGVPEVATSLPSEFGDAGFVLAAGPDDVVYLSIASAVPDELAADVVAITLADGDAGREIGRWSGVANTVGDSSLVPTRDGLVSVGCCGPDTIRPAPDADVLVPWLGRNGEPIALETPFFVIEIEYPSLTVNRKNPDGSTRSWTYEPAGDWMSRGMPNLTATFDGGFVASELGSDGSILARGYADGRLDQVVLGPDFVVASDADPAGRILLGDVSELPTQFARVDPFANGAAQWAGDVTIEPDRSLTFDDTTDVLAGSVVEFVDAIAPAADVNEIRTVEIDRRSETEWTATVTTSNLFDDSVGAVRWELIIEQVDSRTYDVTAGRATQACQPGRGHQDFTTEPCV